MQVSYLYRRGLIVPKNLLADMDLREENISEETPVEHLLIAREDFETIWCAGVFRAISEASGLRVSDYETTRVPPESVPEIANALSAARNRCCDEIVTKFCESAIMLCQAAIDLRAPIYFVL